MEYFTSYANGVMMNHATGEVKKQGQEEPENGPLDTDTGEGSDIAPEGQPKAKETAPVVPPVVKEAATVETKADTKAA